MTSYWTFLEIESLSNHDDDGNKTPQICIFDNEKQYFCTLCTCSFQLLTFWRRSRSFYGVKWPFCSCVDDVSIRWQMFNFVFLCPKRWFQFNSRILRTHFSSKMTLNNWKLIAETQSYFFWWRSRFRRRRVWLSSLMTDSHDQRPSLFSQASWTGRTWLMTLKDISQSTIMHVSSRNFCNSCYVIMDSTAPVRWNVP